MQKWKMKVILGEREATIRIRDKDRIIERVVPTNILSEESKTKISELTQSLQPNQEVWSYHCTICNRRHYRNINENHNSPFFKHFHYAKDLKEKNKYVPSNDFYFCPICLHTHYKSKKKKEGSIYEKHWYWRDK